MGRSQSGGVAERESISRYAVESGDRFGSAFLESTDECSFPTHNIFRSESNDEFSTMTIWTPFLFLTVRFAVCFVFLFFEHII